MPRGVTVAFTAMLQHLTHPGTSVGLGGSPLIHPLSGPQGTLSRSGHLYCADNHPALGAVKSVFDRWLPMRGTMFHPLPPARGFRQHGVAAGQLAAGSVGQEPLGLGKYHFL